MSKKRMIVAMTIVLFAVLVNVWIIRYQPLLEDTSVEVEIKMNSDKENGMQLFYLSRNTGLDKGFQETESQTVNYTKAGKEQVLKYTVPGDTRYLRMDFGAGTSVNTIESIQIKGGAEVKEISQDALAELIETKMLEAQTVGDNLEIRAESNDPHLVWDAKDWGIEELAWKAAESKTRQMKIVLLAAFDLIMLIVFWKRKKFFEIPEEAVKNRKLILRLSKNDFKTKFAGSYLGTIWAFIQPIVTVLVYWFVFEKGLKAGGINTKAGITAPFVLWLVAGLVPWFFFSDALSGGTNALVEYNYLVKKVVFKISVLPIVKVISALFVHIFFIAFTLVLYAGYHYYPDLYTLQIIYYSLCVFLFALGLSYANCAIVVFFRDWTQVINIILQVGVWMTPIMWNIDALDLSPTLITIFKLNPMYYIVSGYREALIGKSWFWQEPTLTIYFWVITIAMFGIGTAIFRRLKVHFADVL